MNNQSHTLQLSERPQNIAVGIGLMLLAILLFSVNDVAGKWLAASYSAPQILLFRSVAALVLLLPILAWTDGFGALFSMPRPGLQVLRAGLAAAETGLFYWSVSYLPLADAMTYYLAGPIYVTLIAVLFLGERVGWRRWAAVIAGFAGVVIALGPSAGSFGWPVFIAFGGSIIYAVFLAMTRVLRGTSDIVMATWQIVASLVIGIVGTPFSYVPIAHLERRRLPRHARRRRPGRDRLHQSLAEARAGLGGRPLPVLDHHLGDHLRLPRLRRRPAVRDAHRRGDHHRRRPVHLLPRTEGREARCDGARDRTGVAARIRYASRRATSTRCTMPCVWLLSAG